MDKEEEERENRKGRRREGEEEGMRWTKKRGIKKNRRRITGHSEKDRHNVQGREGGGKEE